MTITKNIIVFFVIKTLNCIYEKFKCDRDDKDDLTKYVNERNLTKLFIDNNDNIWFLNENIKYIFKFNVFYYIF